jgi:ATP-binding cassette, subfamily F, member 3
MMQKANLLVLDEPTNHLDLDSKEVLENALIDYPGTIIFVSHDRYFVNRMATRIAELTPDAVTSYLGDYDYYVEKKAETAELARLAAEETEQKEESPPAAKSDFKRNKEKQREERQKQRRIEELEQFIEAEEEIAAGIEEDLCLPENFQDHEKSLELNEKLSESGQKIESWMEEWESLQE